MGDRGAILLIDDFDLGLRVYERVGDGVEQVDLRREDLWSSKLGFTVKVTLLKSST